MPVATWVGGDGTGDEQTAFGRDANWSGGVVPDSDDHVIIANTGHNCRNDANRSIASLTINSGATLLGESCTLTLVSEGTASEGTEHYAFKHDGTITGNLDLIFTYNAETAADFAGSGNVRNVTINHTDADVNQVGAATMTSLTITAGIYDAGNDGLTVTGATSITGTLLCNASTVSLGSGKSDGYALTGGGTVNFGTGTITVGAVNTTSASGITKTSGTITFNTTKTGGQSIGPNVTNANSHFNFGTSTVNFDLSGGFGSLFAIEQHVGSSKTFTITAATVNYKSNGRIYQNSTTNNFVKIIGDLVIDASKTLTTYFDNADDFGSKLEVTGNVTLNGTLNAYSASNPRAMSFGSLTINSGGTYSATSGTTTITSETSGGVAVSVASSATFTHNSGTVEIQTPAATFTSAVTFNYNNLIINHSSAAVKFTGASGSTMTIEGDLTITQGSFENNISDANLTVNGDVSVTGTLTGNSGAMTFGSLTINSGGTYSATSGTTTILGSSGGFALLDEGTFTHNGGTVKIDFETSNLNSSTRIHQNGAKKLNNVEIEMNRTTDEVTWSVASGTSQGIAGNLTLTKGESYLYSLAHDFDVDGDFLVDANGTWGSLGHSGAHEAKSLTISSGGTYMATSGTTTITGETSGGYAIDHDGTFTHNNGKVNITTANTLIDITGTSGNLYDLEVNGIVQVPSGTHTIDNNVTIASGHFFSTNNLSSSLTVLGNVNVSGTFWRTDNSGTVTLGGLTINSGGLYRATNVTTIMKGPLRNIGGTIS